MSHLRRMSFGICVLFAALLVGQEAPPGARIAINGQTLFVLRSGVGSFSAKDRAKLVNQRLQEIVKASPATIETKIEKTDVGSLITVGDEPIISVTDADAQAENVSRQELVERWSQQIGHGLQDALNLHSRRTFWRRLGISAAVLFAAVFLIILLRRLHAGGKRALAARRARIPSLRLRGLELVSAERLLRILGRCLWFAYGFGLLLVVIITLLLIFSQFPITQGYAHQVALWIWTPLVAIFRGIVDYLPNLFFILVIIVVTRMVVRGVDFLSQQTDRGGTHSGDPEGAPALCDANQPERFFCQLPVECLHQPGEPQGRDLFGAAPEYSRLVQRGRNRDSVAPLLPAARREPQHYPGGIPGQGRPTATVPRGDTRRWQAESRPIPDHIELAARGESRPEQH